MTAADRIRKVFENPYRAMADQHIVFSITDVRELLAERDAMLAALEIASTSVVKHGEVSREAWRAIDNAIDRAAHS